jgi:hypothetical protein
MKLRCGKRSGLKTNYAKGLHHRKRIEIGETPSKLWLMLASEAKGFSSDVFGI